MILAWASYCSSAPRSSGAASAAFRLAVRTQTLSAYSHSRRRYNGLAGTDRSGKLHVGLIAQDVPDKLAAFCRKRTHVELHSGDTELTEIFILDHSCVPFVCINAIKTHEEQIESFRMRVRGWK